MEVTKSVKQESREFIRVRFNVNYIWLGNNEQIIDEQIININNLINNTTPIDKLSIGGFLNLLFGINIVYDIDRIWS